MQRINSQKVENIAKRLRVISRDMISALDGIKLADLKTDRGQKMLALIIRQAKRQLQKITVRM